MDIAGNPAPPGSAWAGNAAQSDSSARLGDLTPYIPGVILRRLAIDPALPRQATAQRYAAAVLFADITGFTALAGRLGAAGASSAGPSGAEQLSQLLNEYFGRLTALIGEHGGDIVKFAGDALLAIWPADGTDAPGGGLRAASLRAAQCALALQAGLRTYATDDLALSIKIGLGAGELSAFQVGGLDGRWELVLLGPAMAQSIAAEEQAGPRQIVLAPEVADLTRAAVASQPGARPGYRRMTRLLAAPRIEALQPVALPTAAEAALRAYVPPIILGRSAASQTSYLSELRRVTVLFIQLPELWPDQAEADLDRLQVLVAGLQATISRFEGSLNKISVDEKGVALVAAFGLPPHAHEDDAARGALAALAIEQHLADSGLPCAIGVTSGRAFCGIVGGASRREYTLIGDSVNLAAHLMQASKAAPPILCDDATAQAAHDRIRFEALAPIALKGRAAPVGVYRPLIALPTWHKREADRGQQLVGRAAEQAIFEQALDRLGDIQIGSGAGGVYLLEGEAGLGKSRLVQAVQAAAAARGLATYTGASDAVEQTSAYHTWRAIFSELLGLEPFGTTEARREQTERALGPALRDYAPLLSQLLMLDLPDNQLTRPLADQLRAENTRAVLVQLLERAAAKPLVLILEDTHWMDSASWMLALEVARRLPRVLLLLATRPLEEPLPEAYRQLAALPQSRQLRLQPLPDDAIMALVCGRLGVRRLPPAVDELIRTKAEGNPFFSEELAYALRDAEILKIADGECQLAPQIDLSQIAFPDTVQGVVAQRIDKLTPTQQLALKVASVIGRVFAFRVLGAVYPVEIDKPRLPDSLDVLQRLELTPRDLSTLELQYTFKHAITQEVAYSFLLFAQRRELHRTIAEWYERSAADLTPLYPLLAHHWSRAVEGGAPDGEILAKAVGFLAKAGEQALRTSGFREARAFLEQALALIPGDAVTLERAALLNTLGETYFQLSNYTAAQEQLAASLALARQIGDRQAIVNALSNLGRVGWQLGTYAEAETYLEEGLELATELQDMTGVVHILKNLGVVAYYRGKNGPAQFYFERGLQLARELGEPVLIGALLNNVGNSARMGGNYAQAREYYLEGLEFCRKHKIHWVIAMLLGNLALVAHTTGDLDEAQMYHQESLRLHTQNGNKWGIAIVKREMGLVAYDLGDDAAAMGHFHEGLHLALEINALPKVLSNLAGVVMLWERGGRSLKAAELLGLILHHPATDSEARRILKPIEAALGEQLGAEGYAAALERGKTHDLLALVARLGEELGAPG